MAKAVTLEDFEGILNVCDYSSTEEFVSAHYDEIVELFETGSVTVLGGLVISLVFVNTSEEKESA